MSKIHFRLSILIGVAVNYHNSDDFWHGVRCEMLDQMELGKITTANTKNGLDKRQ